MRSSPRRVVSARPTGPAREMSLKDAGLSGARALTRFLMALIESLGQHDRAGHRHAPNWPHGTMRTAFGPTPLGGEIERMMSAPQPPRPQGPAGGQRHVGLEGLLRQAASPAVSSPPAAPRPDGALDRRQDAMARPEVGPAPAARTQPPQPKPLQPARGRTEPGRDEAAGGRTGRHCRPKMASTVAPTAMPAATPPPDLHDSLPAWQRPFIAAPGVRYMRTPDHLLQRARGSHGPFLPIEPEPAPEPAAGPDPSTSDVAVDSFEPPSPPEEASHAITTLNIDEDLLNIEDQAAFRTRLVAPRRLSVTSGIALDLPLPANDLAADLAEDLASTVSDLVASPGPGVAMGRARQPFAVTLRAKPKPGAVPAALPALDETAVSAAAVAARVSLQAEPAQVMPEDVMPEDVMPEDASTGQAAPRRAAPTIEWQYPSPELLGETRKMEGNALTAEMLEQNARLLETTLEDFGIRGEIIHVRAGPVVTLYELEPAPGMKSSRVIGLADDIARSMSALSARVAVVPGRNAIGIELPNLRRETVYLRELLASRDFDQTSQSLAIALGKNIGGEPVIVDLAKMPHLLVAGTTGSGKSVAINTMILSLLYRMKPDECRLIMVDPKMLELSVYDGIPHLLTPVVTDPKKAVVALKWAVREMEDRYKKMAKLGVRNIDGFNARVTQAKAAGEVITMQVTTGFDRETGKPTVENVPLDLVTLPFIVIIVDEMADLMMVAGKDIEGAIQRLAQMARAAGIHLIMATQRPSVDVITGTIKANFPTRISFQVTSKIDSRTILGEQGAEQLLGQGDMLHMQGGGRIYRVHGPFVSDEDVERVVAHLKAQGQPDYLDTVTEDVDADAGEDDEDAPETAVFDKTAMAAGPEDDNSLYEQAVKVVLRDKKSSVSYVQRRLAVGYNKAASLIERMEREGVLGPANHTGKREILAHGRGRVISGVPAVAGEE